MKTRRVGRYADCFKTPGSYLEEGGTDILWNHSTNNMNIIVKQAVIPTSLSGSHISPPLFHILLSPCKTKVRIIREQSDLCLHYFAFGQHSSLQG